MATFSGEEYHLYSSVAKLCNYPIIWTACNNKLLEEENGGKTEIIKDIKLESLLQEGAAVSPYIVTHSMWTFY